MPPQTAKSLMKEFRASFRRKKVVVDPSSRVTAAKEVEDEELAKLAEMKENMGDQLPSIYSDFDLLGFLRARSLNVKEAEKLTKLDENTKKILAIDEHRIPEEKSQYNFSSLIGVDKEGSVVRLINMGGADIKGICHLVSTIDALKLLICMIKHDMEVQEVENRKSDRNCKQMVYIANLEDLSMSQVSYKPAFDMIMQVLKLLQDHYHDVLKKIYVVNAPSFFSSVFKLLKPVIQDSLQQKIKFLDSDSFKGELLKSIDQDVLPKYLGGERVDSKGDPRCREFVYFGNVVPESCYASNFLNPDDPDVVVATIPAGATVNFRFPVRQTASIMHWHIQAKDNDIGLGLFREPFSNSTEETSHTRKKKEEDMSRFEQLAPIVRSQCHLCPEEGSAVIWFTGNVILHFDNSYSWMNSKDVFFKIEITPPTANAADSVANKLGRMALGKSK